MKIKFSNPTSFDGVHRSCIEYKNTRVGKRCKLFEEGRKHPKCTKLRGGGRSQNYLRPSGCPKGKRK